MRICLIAATEIELKPFTQKTIFTHHEISYHIHGVGMPIAAYHISKIAFSKPDLIIQCGIAGAYHERLSIGQTVVVENDGFDDLGAESFESSLNLFELGFIQSNEYPFEDRLLKNPHLQLNHDLQKVNAITVNMSSGLQSSIDKRIRKYNADIETMEGAILHYICLMERIKFIQFRGISNYIEPRDTGKWKIQLAINSYVTPICNYIQSYI